MKLPFVIALLVSLTAFVHGDSCGSMDVALLLDTSQSITSQVYGKVLTYAADLVEQFTIGPQNVQFAGAVFNEDVRTQWPLNKYPSKTALSAAIKQLPYVVGITNFDNAFKAASSLLAGTGARHNSCKVVLLFTDGWLNQGDVPTSVISQLSAAPTHAQVIAVAVDGIHGLATGFDLKTLSQVTGSNSLVFDMAKTHVSTLANQMKMGKPSVL